MRLRLFAPLLFIVTVALEALVLPARADFIDAQQRSLIEERVNQAQSARNQSESFHLMMRAAQRAGGVDPSGDSSSILREYQEGTAFFNVGATDMRKSVDAILSAGKLSKNDAARYRQYFLRKIPVYQTEAWARGLPSNNGVTARSLSIEAAYRLVTGESHRDITFSRAYTLITTVALYEALMRGANVHAAMATDLFKHYYVVYATLTMGADPTMKLAGSDRLGLKQLAKRFLEAEVADYVHTPFSKASCPFDPTPSDCQLHINNLRQSIARSEGKRTED